VYELEPNGDVVLLNEFPTDLLPSGLTADGYNPHSRSIPGEPKPLRFLRYSNWMTPFEPSPDIYEDGILIRGKGWHQLEQVGEIFRWVENDVEIVLTDPQSENIVLQIDVEPGPGVGSKPFTLVIQDYHREVVLSVEIESRETIEIPLTVARHQSAHFYLHVDNGGLPTPNGDPRTLNFRIFNLSTK
jgi:hypothetical protein